MATMTSVAAATTPGAAPALGSHAAQLSTGAPSRPPGGDVVVELTFTQPQPRRRFNAQSYYKQKRQQQEDKPVLRVALLGNRDTLADAAEILWEKYLKKKCAAGALYSHIWGFQPNAGSGAFGRDLVGRDTYGTFVTAHVPLLDPRLGLYSWTSSWDHLEDGHTMESFALEDGCRLTFQYDSAPLDVSVKLTPRPAELGADAFPRVLPRQPAQLKPGAQLSLPAAFAGQVDDLFPALARAFLSRNGSNGELFIGKCQKRYGGGVALSLAMGHTTMDPVYFMYPIEKMEDWLIAADAACRAYEEERARLRALGTWPAGFRVAAIAYPPGLDRGRDDCFMDHCYLHNRLWCRWRELFGKEREMPEREYGKGIQEEFGATEAEVGLRSPILWMKPGELSSARSALRSKGFSLATAFPALAEWHDGRQYAWLRCHSGRLQLNRQSMAGHVSVDHVREGYRASAPYGVIMDVEQRFGSLHELLQAADQFLQKPAKKAAKKRRVH